MMLRLNLLTDCLLAAFLPLYFLDDSLIPKSPYLGVVIALLAFRFIVQEYSIRDIDITIFLAGILFLSSYCMSVVYSTYNGIPTINVVYPIIFFGILIAKPAISLLPERVFVVSAFVVVLIGWIRYLTGNGGLPSEHALGYWGIKYDIATRNSDVLLPLIVACATIGAIARNARSNVLPSKVRSAIEVPRVRFVIHLGAMLIALSAILLSQSRGTWLSAILMILLMFGKDLRSLSRFVQLGIALVIGSTVALAMFPEVFEKLINVGNLLDRFSTIYTGGGGSSNSARWHLIQYSFELSARYPIFGVGLDGFNCCALKYGYVDILTTRHPENFYLHMMTGFGVVSAASITFLLFKSALLGFKSRVGYTHLLGGVLYSVLLYLQFNSEVPSLALWIVLGAIVARIARSDRLQV